MGRDGRHTGSFLLGAELRRLRGTRTLDDIARLTATPPLSRHVEPVAAPTLSQIENAIGLPRVETLYALSVAYKVSLGHLVALVVEERLRKDAGQAELPADVPGAFARAVAEGRWFDAFDLAARAERNATTDRERVGWRANRASCLGQIGLAEDAIALLSDCVESPDVSELQRFHCYLNLARAQARAGRWRGAADAARTALELATSARVPPELTDELKGVRAAVLVDAYASGASRDQATLREALRLLDERAGRPAADGDPERAQARLVRAVAHQHLGNELVAESDLVQLVDEGARARLPWLEMIACLNLGTMRHDQRRLLEAERWLQRAEALAPRVDDAGAQFALSFALLRLTSETRPSHAPAHARRCEELLPVVPARSRWTQAFERMRAVRS